MESIWSKETQLLLDVEEQLKVLDLFKIGRDQFYTCVNAEVNGNLYAEDWLNRFACLPSLGNCHECSVLGLVDMVFWIDYKTEIMYIHDKACTWRVQYRYKCVEIGIGELEIPEFKHLFYVDWLLGNTAALQRDLVLLRLAS